MFIKTTYQVQPSQDVCGHDLLEKSKVIDKHGITIHGGGLATLFNHYLTNHFINDERCSKLFTHNHLTPESEINTTTDKKIPKSDIEYTKRYLGSVSCYYRYNDNNDGVLALSKYQDGSILDRAYYYIYYREDDDKQYVGMALQTDDRDHVYVLSECELERDAVNTDIVVTIGDLSINMKRKLIHKPKKNTIATVMLDGIKSCFTETSIARIMNYAVHNFDTLDYCTLRFHLKATGNDFSYIVSMADDCDVTFAETTIPTDSDMGRKLTEILTNGTNVLSIITSTVRNFSITHDGNSFAPVVTDLMRDYHLDTNTVKKYMLIKYTHGNQHIINAPYDGWTDGNDLQKVVAKYVLDDIEVQKDTSSK